MPSEANLEASITPTSNTVAIGSTAVFSVSVSGGTAPYTYQWYESGQIISAETSSQMSITKNSEGTYTFYCEVTDNDGAIDTTATATLTVTSHSQVTEWVLTIETSAGGTTIPSPGSYNYAENAEVQVTAQPDTGYSFDHFIIDGENETSNPTTIIMDSDHNLRVVFTSSTLGPSTSETDETQQVKQFETISIALIITCLAIIVIAYQRGQKK